MFRFRNDMYGFKNDKYGLKNDMNGFKNYCTDSKTGVSLMYQKAGGLSVRLFLHWRKCLLDFLGVLVMN
jgi:hypothetical protein